MRALADLLTALSVSDVAQWVVLAVLVLELASRRF